MEADQRNWSSFWPEAWTMSRWDLRPRWLVFKENDSSRLHAFRQSMIILHEGRLLPCDQEDGDFTSISPCQNRSFNFSGHRLY
jgi:hypothetical protein